MAAIKLQREILRNALERSQLKPEEAEAIGELIGDGARTVHVTLEASKLPTNYLASLLNEATLNATQRAMISMRVHGIRGDRSEYERIYDSLVSTPVQFASTFAALGIQSPNCELFINGRWYPITLGAQCHEDESKLFCSVSMQGTLSIGDIQESLYFHIPSHFFHTETGDPREISVRDVLTNLPPDMLSILTTVFTAPTEAVFGDLIAGKHGGLVILASGRPGVGKTLTAEVYSELTQRPLYVLELGELGTSANEVEENLNRVFTRVARWDAVLQFDECEIFLARRGNDLERSAIVGIFLRLLDYYRGILFLTTNRSEVLDGAVLSRVTLRLEYPDLDAATRQCVWTTMLELAGLSIEDGCVSSLADLPLNGRQIRNVVRLAKVVYSGGMVSADAIVKLVNTAVPDMYDQSD